MNNTKLITNGTITIKEAHKAAHAAPSSLSDRLGAHTNSTGAARYPAFQDSVEDALLADCDDSLCCREALIRQIVAGQFQVERRQW